MTRQHSSAERLSSTNIINSFLTGEEGFFTSKIVFDYPHFIASATRDQRQWLHPRPDGDGSIYRIGDLPECMFKTDILPPYSHSLLVEFINVKDKVIAFRGGARSGKSSSIHFLERFCRKCNEQCKMEIKAPSCPIIMIIECFKTTKEPATTEELYDLISEKAIWTIQQYLDNYDDELYCDLISKTFLTEMPQGTLTNLETTLLTISKKLARSNWNSLDLIQKLEFFESILESMDARKRFEAVLLLFFSPT